MSATIVSDVDGRHVVAARNLEPGEVVFRTPPFDYLLHPSFWDSRCSKCFIKEADVQDETLLRCGACKKVNYCSKACQKKDWKNHKKECKVLASAKADNVSLADALLVGRAIRKKNDKASEFKEVAELVWHEEIETTMVDPNTVSFAITSGLVPKNSGKEASQILSRFHSNNFGIADELLVVVGAGIYPQGAMLNHSCDNTCVITYEPLTHVQVIRTIRAVAAGEELTHPYIDLAATTAERQHKLLSTYGFTCKCSRCEDPSGSWRELDLCLSGPRDRDSGKPGSSQKDVQRALNLTDKMLQQAQCCEDDAEEFDKLKRVVALRERTLHRWHLQLLSARGSLYTVALVLGEWDCAIAQLRAMIEVYEQVYQPIHPMLGIQLFTLGNILHNLDQQEEAIEHLERARTILQCTHGEGNGLIEGISGLLGH